MKYFIYGLIDPRPEHIGELRYIGQSSTGMRRPKQRHHAKCCNWQTAVRARDFQEEIWVIEEWDGYGDWKTWLDDVETFFIGYFRMIGANLTNMTDGGEGTRGWKPSEE